MTILADRGFGDQKLFAFLGELGFGYVIRFRGNIHVTAEDGETKSAAAWVGKGGRARKLRHARVTAQGRQVGAVVCVHAKGMKQPWCLAASDPEATAAVLVNHYARRWTIEPAFRDTKDLRFGMGLSATRIGEPMRRDRLLLISAFATALLTLLGAVGESLGMDRLLKSNTSKTRTHSLFRQGCMLYDLIPNMPEHRLAPLIAALRPRAVANASEFSGLIRAKTRGEGIIEFIDQVLDEDRRAPRKQRHTARRIYHRILEEFPGVAVAESTVRNHVRERKRALGLVQRETFVPQSYALGHEAQVDWYEAWADLGGERTRLQVFAMRSMASGAAFHRAYLHATQQAFLEAHEQAFAYFGGVFRLLRYDNLASAVRKILRGHRREETVRFVAFRSHWRFAAEFCTPGEGHEKGGVEGEGGYFRRNHLVPVPDVADLDALNALLLTGCREDEARILDGRTEPVGAAMVAERDHLLACAIRRGSTWPRCRSRWSTSRAA